MDNFCDEQKNMECNIREIKIRNFHWVPCKVPAVTTHVYSCRHLHSSSLSLRDLALSLSRAPRTPHLSLWCWLYRYDNITVVTTVYQKHPVVQVIKILTTFSHETVNLANIVVWTKCTRAGSIRFRWCEMFDRLRRFLKLYRVNKLKWKRCWLHTQHLTSCEIYGAIYTVYSWL